MTCEQPEGVDRPDVRRVWHRGRYVWLETPRTDDGEVDELEIEAARDAEDERRSLRGEV